MTTNIHDYYYDIVTKQQTAEMYARAERARLIKTARETVREQRREARAARRRARRELRARNNRTVQDSDPAATREQGPNSQQAVTAEQTSTPQQDRVPVRH